MEYSVWQKKCRGWLSVITQHSQDSRFKITKQENIQIKMEKVVINEIYNTVHNLPNRSRTRVMTRCASLWFEIDQPHSGSTGSDPHCIWLPQCQMSHPGESGGLILASVILTTTNQITINIGYVQYIPRNMHTVLLCFALLWLCNRS